VKMNFTIMKEPTTAELRSWTPRAPSPEVRRSLFDPGERNSAAFTGNRETRLRWSTYWSPFLAPAVGCAAVLIGVGLFPQSGVRNSAFAAGERSETPELAALRSALSQSSENSVAGVRFTWTNLSPTHTTYGSSAATN
jgi:hypothetical protein